MTQIITDFNSKTLDATKKKLLDDYCLGTTILDLGAGSCKYSAYLGEPKKKIISVDSQKYCRYSESFSLIQADAKYIPLKAKSVDTCVCFDVLEHLDISAINEVIRVTKKRILGTLPKTTDKCLRDNWLLFGHHQDRTHQRTYEINNLKSTFERLNLRTVLLNETHPISTEKLYLSILEGPNILKKVFRKFTYRFLKARKFNTTLAFVVDI
jgi:ubiquinone/menaquinone biosynthesis C-methylase UbiE